MENRNQKMIDDLKKLVEFLEDRPTIEFSGGEQTFYVSCSVDELKDFAAQAGTTTKSHDATWFNLDKRIGSHIRIHAYTDRNAICEKIKVGEKVIPAREEKYIPGRVEPAEPERVIDVFEWKCPPSLLCGNAIVFPDPADVLQSAAESLTPKEN